ALDIALDAGDLAGKAQSLHNPEAKPRVEQHRAVKEGVAVKPAQPGELGLLEAGNHAEDPLLLGVLQLGLEADDVVERAERIVLVWLDTRVRPRAVARLGEAARLHGPVAQRVDTASRHDLDRQAALEIGR